MNVLEVRSLLGRLPGHSKFQLAVQRIEALCDAEGARVEVDPSGPARELADIYGARARRVDTMKKVSFGLPETALVLRGYSGPVIPIVVEAVSGIGLIFVLEEDQDTILACIFLEKR